MNKDIIYIDTDDDITSIIGKIKASKEQVVALVPPKRTGLLQSAVNLRLLARIARNSEKDLVIVTNNKALIALTAAARIPVAKNLQSKPEIAEIAAQEIDDGEDIIEGAQLPVGELVKTTDFSKAKEEDIAEDIGSIDIDNEGPQYVPPTSSKSGIPHSDKALAKNKIKVPDFPEFRKKLFLGVGGGILFIVFTIWATWFAPAATVIITAKTEPAPVSMTLTLSGASATDINKNIVQTVSKQIKKDVSVDFTATGQKDLGAKAAGSITIRNCDYSDGLSLPAGTQFVTNGDQVFVSTAAVSVPKFSGLPSACTLSGSASGKATVQVQASVSGETYNNAGVPYTISSIPTGAKVDANGSAMTGGTTRMATVVTADDIQKAGQALVDLPTDDVKQQLKKQFTNGETVISDSFNIDRSSAVSAPTVGSEAVNGKAKLTSATTFTMTAIAKSELESFLREAINKQISGKSQRIYSNGVDKINISGYVKGDSTATVNIAATGQIGPNIDPKEIKAQVKGKNFGDAQSIISDIQGVNNVEVKYSYFWVTTIPGDVNKIEVKFVVEHA